MSYRNIKNLGIVNYMSGLGQTKKGVGYSPMILTNHIKKKYNIEINSYTKLYKSNDTIVQGEMYEKIINDNFNLSQNIKKSFQENDKTLVLGGDHSLGLGSVAASIENNIETNVIWIDAHADINTPSQSESNNFHGMPLSFLCNISNEEIPWLKHYLNPDNLIYIGLRDVDDFEKETLLKYNILHYSAKETIHNLPDILVEVSKKIKNKPVHLSVDVDAFDPSFIFSTGAPVNNGLNIDHFYHISDMINQSTDENKIMDLAELNLQIGTKQQKQASLKNSLKIINKWLGW